MHLFNKENIWSNPQQFPASCIHPDKYNNSVNRIISKEEEREDPRRDSSIYLRVQWCFHIPTRTTRFLRIQCILQCFYTQSSKFPVIPCHSTYRINSSPRTTRLIPCRLLPATVPRVSKHSTWQNKAPGPPYSISKPYSTSRLPVILPGRNSILHGSQHPHSPYSSSQASSTILHYRILPGENRIHSKGLSIVCLCNTKVSVFQFTYSCLRIIPQEY